MDWYTYILRCRDGSFYTGITNDLTSRVKKHNLGRGSKYVFSRRPARLIYSEGFGSKVEAGKREIEIKKWKREKKKLLIKGKLS